VTTYHFPPPMLPNGVGWPIGAGAGASIPGPASAGTGAIGVASGGVRGAADDADGAGRAGIGAVEPLATTGEAEAN
jgi:hypothetical protein